MKEIISIQPASGKDLSARICVIGVGGAGGNAVDYMIHRGVEGVDFITANTDSQALAKTLADIKIILGETVTKGLGAGTDPELGRQATEESASILKEYLQGYNLIFIAAGMGGGTGTGGAPVIARIATEAGALVIGVVAKCFTREGTSKSEKATLGIKELKKNLDSIIVVENDIISKTYPDLNRLEAFGKANDVLHNAVRGIVNIASKEAYINTDMNDIIKTLSGAGDTIIGTGTARGEDALKEALQNALNSPFFDRLTLRNQTTVLLSMEYGPKYTVRQVDEAMNELQNVAGGNIDLKMGELIDEAYADEVTVTILAPAQYNDSDNIGTNKGVIPNGLKDIKQKKNNSKMQGNSPDLLFDNNEAVIGQEYLSNNGKIRIDSPRVINEDMQVITGPLANNQQFVERPRGNEQLKILDIPTWERQGISNSKYGIEKNIQNEFDDTDTNTMPDDERLDLLQDLVNKSSANNKSKNKIIQIVSNRKQ